jgi:hypothetical protein
MKTITALEQIPKIGTKPKESLLGIQDKIILNYNNNTLHKLADKIPAAILSLILKTKFQKDQIEISKTKPIKELEDQIDYLSINNNNMVFLVTHLGSDLVYIKNKVRFDGIEAKGLDDKLNLIVDRNPKIDYIATSTPKLIVERLASVEKSDFFEFLHKKMQS